MKKVMYIVSSPYDSSLHLFDTKDEAKAFRKKEQDFGYVKIYIKKRIRKV